MLLHQSADLLIELHAFRRIGFRFLVEFIRMSRVGFQQSFVTAFGTDEVLEGSVRGCLDVPGERSFGFFV